MNFSEALELLGRARVLRRLEWGLEKFVVAQIATRISQENIDKIKSLPSDAKNILYSLGKGIVYKDQILVINADGEATNWTPSNSDLFATDWYVVECQK